jgi:hypothetical protein
LEIIGEKYGFKLTDPIENPEEAMEMILNEKKNYDKLQRFRSCSRL